MNHQEKIVFAIVGICTAHLLWRAVRQVFGEWIARWLLKRGLVSLAMRLRKANRSSSCQSCQCSEAAR